MRGLGKHLPVISSYKLKEYGKDRNVLKYHIDCPTLLFSKIETGMLVLSLRTENDLPVVKDHGNAVFVNPSRMRSRRKHRFNETEPISTEPLLSKKGKVMATSDIGLQNVK